MKLFLTSVGLPPETTEYFLKLLDKEPSESKVCFIPTAADQKENKWFLDVDKKRLEELGFSVTELDIKGENEKSLTDKFKSFDVVYVEGGNTFYLLKHMRDCGFKEAIKTFLDRGGVYLGLSAGSITMGQNIESSVWKGKNNNEVDLKDFTGLNFVPFVVCVHIDESNMELIKEKAKETGYPVIALTDKQAFLVDGQKQEIVGEGEKITFNI